MAGYSQKTVFKWNIICMLLIVNISSRNTVQSIVTKYRLDSAALVDLYYPPEEQDFEVDSPLNSNDTQINKYEQSDIVILSNDTEILVPEKLQATNAIPILLLRFLYKRVFKFKSKNHVSKYLWDSTTRSGLDIELKIATNEPKGARTKIHSVYPGTMWCGPGNVADHDFSVGFFHETDKCCRQHDKCFDSIPGGTHRHGLNNPGQFTRSHCDCDRKFYRCLKRADSFVSHKIGVTYFNILRPQCFRREFPIITCIPWYDGRCSTYIVNERKMPIWQWFDNKEF